MSNDLYTSVDEYLQGSSTEDAAPPFSLMGRLNKQSTYEPEKVESDTFTGQFGLSVDQAQKSMYQGLLPYARKLGLEGLEAFAQEGIKQQEKDISRYKPSEFEGPVSELMTIDDVYEEEGLGAALLHGVNILKLGTAQALGSMVPMAGAAAGAGAAAIAAPISGATAAGAGAFLAGSLMGTGSVYTEAKKLGADEQDAQNAAMVAGPVIGYIDKVGGAAVVKNLVSKAGKDAVVTELGKDIGELQAETLVDRALKVNTKDIGKVLARGNKSAVTEAGTEAVQEGVQMGAVAAVTEGLDTYEAGDVTLRLLDGAVLGALGGKTAGFASDTLGYEIARNAARMEQSVRKAEQELKDTVENEGSVAIIQKQQAVADAEKALKKASKKKKQNVGVLDRLKKDVDVAKEALQETEKEVADRKGTQTQLDYLREYTIADWGVFDKPMRLMRRAMSPLASFGRRSPIGREYFNNLHNYYNRVSNVVAADVQRLNDTLRPLMRDRKLPFGRAFDPEIEKELARFLETGTTLNPQVAAVGAEVRSILGNLEQRELKINRKTLDEALTNEDANFGLLEQVTDEAANTIEIQEQFNGLRQLTEELKAKHKTDTVNDAVLKDLRKDNRYKLLNKRVVQEAKYTEGSIFDNLKKSGADIDFTEDYYPAALKAEAFGKRKEEAAQIIADNEGISVEEADQLLYDIKINDGYEIPVIEELEEVKRETTRASTTERGFQKRRGFSKETRKALLENDFYGDNTVSALLTYADKAAHLAESAKIVREGNAIIRAERERQQQLKKLQKDIAKAEKDGTEVPTIPEELKQELITDTERQHLKNVIDAIEHKFNPLKSKTVEGLQKYALTATYMATMTGAAITALVEPMVILGRLPANHFLYGLMGASHVALRQAMRAIKPTLEYSPKEEVLRTTLQNMDGAMAQRFNEINNVTLAKKLGNAYFKAIGLTQVTQFNRYMATLAMDRMMKEDIKRMAAESESGKTTKGGIAARKRMNEVGLTKPDKQQEILDWALGATETQPPIIQQALSRSVDEFVMAPNALNRPLWMSDPHYATLAQLKGFMMVFSNTVGGRLFNEIVQPIMKGDPINAEAAFKGGLMLMLLIGGALATQALKDEIRYGDEESPFDKKEGYQQFIDALAGTNLIAPATLLNQILNAPRYGADPITATAGPFWSIASSGIKSLTPLTEGNARPIASWITKNIPVLGWFPLVGENWRQELVDSVAPKKE